MPESRGIMKKVAMERIEILYDASRRAFPEHKLDANNYVRNLFLISKHYKIRLPIGIRTHLCKVCLMPLIEGENLEIRVLAKEKRRIYRCRGCKGTSSFPFGSL